VAGEANLVLRRRGAQLARKEPTMWVVATAASHQAFIYAMVRGFDEVCLGLKVARIAELRLRLLQKRLFNSRSVNRMAVNATHIVLLVLGATEVGVLLTELMAIEATTAGIRRGKPGKADDLGGIASTLYVLFAGAVARLAAAPFGSTLFIEISLPMRPVIVAFGLSIMAGGASVAAYVQGCVSRPIAGASFLAGFLF